MAIDTPATMWSHTNLTPCFLASITIRTAAERKNSRISAVSDLDAGVTLESLRNGTRKLAPRSK